MVTFELGRGEYDWISIFKEKVKCNLYRKDINNYYLWNMIDIFQMISSFILHHQKKY